MNKHTEKIDEIIREALTEEEAAFYKELEEPSAFKTMTGIFTGRWSWLVWLTSFLILVFTILAVICAINFFNASDTKELMMWGGAFFSCGIVVISLKVWNWMQIDKNDLMREIKRLEFQIAVLAEKKFDK